MNYYNEFDKKSATWLRELIKQGLIPPGDVDERSITEVNPDEIRNYTQCHFFAGIGGWSRALQLANWPTNRTVWTGSCPCQPYSSAGKGKGDKDPRNLWPQFFCLIRQCEPDVVFGEQVASAINKGWLDGIQSDLEKENYACGATVLGAHSVGAPHIRQRLYWVANRQRRGRQHGGIGTILDGVCQTQQNLPMPSEERSPCHGMANPRHTIREHKAEQKGGNQSDGCCTTGLGNPSSVRQCGGVQNQTNQPAEMLGQRSEGNNWSKFDFVNCKDGKVRRVPVLEPVFHRMDDGIHPKLDSRWAWAVFSASYGFPIATRFKGRTTIVKGYGNAIVPQVAAQFILAFKEITGSK